MIKHSFRHSPSNFKFKFVLIALVMLINTFQTTSSANAAWIQYQNSPADTYNRPELPADYDIIRTDFGVNDARPDEYWFVLVFAKPVSANLFADGKGSWAGVFLDVNNDGSLDYSLETSTKAFEGNYFQAGDFIDRTSGKPVDSSKCSVNVWTNLNTQANWISFSLKKDCLTFAANIGIQGYSDYIASDGAGFDYAPDEIWKVSINSGAINATGNSTSSTILGDLPSLNQSGFSEITNPSNQPNDLVSLAAQTTKSVVTVLCGDQLGSGWSIAVALSNSNIVNGYKSYVITNHHVISKCTTNRNISLVLSDQTKVSGYVYTWDEPNDVAGILTTTLIPTLNWRGQTPQQGWWVGVLGSPLGYPGILTTGIVSSIYPSTYLGTTTAPINPGNSGGPVFDRTGRVLGLATAKRIDAEGFGIFNGAPLLCGKILNCTDKNLVWGTASNNSNTTSSTATNSTYSSSEVAKIISDSFAAYQISVKGCIDVSNSTSIVISKYLNIMQLNKKCSLSDAQTKSILADAQKIANKSTITSADLLLFNSYVDKMNSLSESVDAVNAEIQDVITNLTYIISNQDDSKVVLKLYSDVWSVTNKRISKLPLSLQKRIRSSSEYIQIQSSKDEWQKFNGVINDLLNSISSSSSPQYISNSYEEIQSLEPQNAKSSLEYSLALIDKMIPKFVCVRGKDVSLLTGKNCKVNYKKMSV